MKTETCGEILAWEGGGSIHVTHIGTRFITSCFHGNHNFPLDFKKSLAFMQYWQDKLSCINWNRIIFSLKRFFYMESVHILEK